MNDSVQDFIAKYFEPVCRELLTDYFVRRGFNKITVNDIGGVKYCNDIIFLQVTYYPENYPKYSPMVNIGFERAIRETLYEGVGLWTAIPESAPERQYGLWFFAGEEELRSCLIKMRDKVIAKYAEPLWNNTGELTKLIQLREQDDLHRKSKEEVVKKRSAAERAFQSQNYNEVVRIYSKMDRSQMSLADLKRLEIAKNKQIPYPEKTAGNT